MHDKSNRRISATKKKSRRSNRRISATKKKSRISNRRRSNRRISNRRRSNRRISNRRRSATKKKSRRLNHITRMRGGMLAGRNPSASACDLCRKIHHDDTMNFIPMDEITPHTNQLDSYPTDFIIKLGKYLDIDIEINDDGTIDDDEIEEGIGSIEQKLMAESGSHAYFFSEYGPKGKGYYKKLLIKFCPIKMDHSQLEAEGEPDPLQERRDRILKLEEDQRQRRATIQEQERRIVALEQAAETDEREMFGGAEHSPRKRVGFSNEPRVENFEVDKEPGVGTQAHRFPEAKYFILGRPYANKREKRWSQGKKSYKKNYHIFHELASKTEGFDDNILRRLKEEHGTDIDPEWFKRSFIILHDELLKLEPNEKIKISKLIESIQTDDDKVTHREHYGEAGWPSHIFKVTNKNGETKDVEIRHIDVNDHLILKEFVNSS